VGETVRVLARLAEVVNGGEGHECGQGDECWVVWIGRRRTVVWLVLEEAVGAVRLDGRRR
jgi:hypothetical protein